MAMTNEEMQRTFTKFLAVLNQILEANRSQLVVRSGRGAASVDTTGIQNRLDSILAKLLVAPATEAKQDSAISFLTSISLEDFATQATLADILAKIIAAPATEAKQDDMESSLNTLVAANAANFGLNIAEMGIQTTLNIAAIVANAATSVAGMVIQTIANNLRLSAIETAVDEVKAKIIAAPATEAKQDTANTSLGSIDTAINNIEAVAGYWEPTTLGRAITGGELVLSKLAGNGSVAVFNTDLVKYDGASNEGSGAAMSFRMAVATGEFIRVMSSMIQMSANDNARTCQSIVRSIHLTSVVHQIHQTSSTTDNWAANDDKGYVYMNTQFRMDVFANGALADEENYHIHCDLEIWRPAV